jgi:hypothetical protein
VLLRTLVVCRLKRKKERKKEAVARSTTSSSAQLPASGSISAVAFVCLNPKIEQVHAEAKLFWTHFFSSQRIFLLSRRSSVFLFAGSVGWGGEED